MILGEKVTELRKKNNWSQEELAGQLGISRQSVSKWESGASIPDMDKIIALSNLFSVSTDYLLKDELGEETPSESKAFDDFEGRKVTVEEANRFLEQTGVFAQKISFAVMLFIFSPICLIFLAGLSEAGMMNENFAAGIGIMVLLVLVAAGVAIVIINSVSYGKYDYLENECFVTEYGVEGIVHKGKEAFMPTFTKSLSIGVTFCILSAIPLILIGAMELEKWATCGVAFLLLLVGFGVNQIVNVCIIQGGYQKLLQEGDYTPEEKQFQRRTKYFSAAYWTFITGIFLLISLYHDNWDASWIIWPVAALFFAALRGILHMILKNNVK